VGNGDMGDAEVAGMTGASHPLGERHAGVVCHVTSLPGTGAGGRLGAEALQFVEFLARAGLRLWQVLPLNPPDRYGSPYQSTSLSACSTLLADWDRVEQAGGLAALRRRDGDAFGEFCARERPWLDDFAVYSVAEQVLAAPWWQWPAPLRAHEAQAVVDFAVRHAEAVEQVRLQQFVVFSQWHAVRRAANARGVRLLGDIPLYPALASADVWANQDLFELTTEGQPIEVAGVPPDYFSATGQLWGNPLYAWSAHAADGFRWWLARIGVQLELFDAVRIDHFRGLEAYWSIPAAATQATAGRWRPAPGHALLDAVQARFPALPLVAEDLGIITPAVEALRDAFALPGMRVLQFAFSGDPTNPHLPDNFVPETLAYTGTHDNDTSLGWYQSLDDATRRNVDQFLGGAPEMPWSFIEAVFASCANSALAPLQDYLALDSDGRMNTPGRAQGNWRWQCRPGQLDAALADRIRAAVVAADR
jgi:4-alpha-glucanotransferase